MAGSKKYNVRTKGRMFVVFLFFGAIICTFGYTFIFNLKQFVDMKIELNDLNEEKKELVMKEEELEADIKRLSDSLYMARYARERYLYSRDGEIILRFEE